MTPCTMYGCRNLALPDSVYAYCADHDLVASRAESFIQNRTVNLEREMAAMRPAPPPQRRAVHALDRIGELPTKPQPTAAEQRSVEQARVAAAVQLQNAWKESAAQGERTREAIRRNAPNTSTPRVNHRPRTMR